MSASRKAKLFRNGASQAVRLPAEFRFDGEEVYIRRDENTGDVIISEHEGKDAWKDFFDLLHSIDVPEEFMATRPLNDLPQERELFGRKR